MSKNMMTPTEYYGDVLSALMHILFEIENNKQEKKLKQ
jgi:hypothetical protein